MEVVELSVDHHQILRTLLQNIGITYDPEFHNLLLEGYDESIGFTNHYKLKPGEAQWLRVAFRELMEPCIEECDGSTGSVSSNEFGETEWSCSDPMEPCPPAGRIYVRNNVNGESGELLLCFVTL